MRYKKHIGSSFDEFLEDEELLTGTSIIATKRVLSWHISKTMQDENISKVEMAKRMSTSRAVLDRLLDPKNSSVTLSTMHRAAAVLGKQIRIELVGGKSQELFHSLFRKLRHICWLYQGNKSTEEKGILAQLKELQQQLPCDSYEQYLLENVASKDLGNTKASSRRGNIEVDINSIPRSPVRALKEAA
jgi:DNA-binding Xre family transcriptional regulator